MSNHAARMETTAAYNYLKGFTDDFTDEQLDTPNIGVLLDVVVRRSPNYIEVVKNRVFKKTA